MRILFFAPHTALWVHAVPEAYLARGLAECGHQIDYLTCGRAQTYCAPMTARRLEPGCSKEQRSRICKACEAGANAVSRVYSFEMDSLSRHLTQQDREDCEEIAADAARRRTLDTAMLGVNVGRLALYEFTLAYKKMSTELTVEQWRDYEIYLANALVTLRSFSRYLESSRPDAILTFSPQYSNNNSCMQYAIAQGVKVMFIESGTNLSHRLGTMRVWDWGVHRLVNPALKYWGATGQHPVNAGSARAVSEHFRQLLSGQHFAVFSSPYAGDGVGIRQRWGVKPQQRVLLMTLSSYDEAYAAFLIDGFPREKVFSDVFRTQAEWVRATIEWVKSRPDLFLVIRVHPRDFPNKREQVQSEQSLMLEHLLRQAPGNVHVNWPSEGVSLYELLEDAEVILTGWSVTAMEGLVLGIPVVTYDERLPSYPRDIMYTGRSEEAYYENIKQALIDGWQLKNVINGFRWLAFNFITCTVTVSDRFGQFELARKRKMQHLWSRIKNNFVIVGQLDLLKWRGAIAGAKVVSTMLVGGFDAIPPARDSMSGQTQTHDDTSFILSELEVLHDLLYADSSLPNDKPGLSLSIRKHLQN